MAIEVPSILHFIDLDLRFDERKLLMLVDGEVEGAKLVRVLQWRKKTTDGQGSAQWSEWEDVPARTISRDIPPVEPV